jgi:hypothetical protein
VLRAHQRFQDLLGEILVVGPIRVVGVAANRVNVGECLFELLQDGLSDLGIGFELHGEGAGFRDFECVGHAMRHPIWAIGLP